MRLEKLLLQPKKQLLSSNQADVVSFLNAYFGSGVDCAPNEARVKYTKYRWSQLYKTFYKEHCRLLEREPVSYHEFCRTRKHHCPHFKRSRRTRRGGWNHLSCGTCDSLKRKIAHAPDEKTRKGSEEKLEDHHKFQEKHGNYYYFTRAKAIRRMSDNDVSMIVDASGGTGTTYSPRYRTTEKGEPSRHSVLKAKNTFSKVHGVGTYVYQSLPELEGQGSNLVCEVNTIILFEWYVYNPMFVLCAGYLSHRA